MNTEESAWGKWCESVTGKLKCWAVGWLLAERPYASSPRQRHVLREVWALGAPVNDLGWSISKREMDSQALPEWPCQGVSGVIDLGEVSPQCQMNVFISNCMGSFRCVLIAQFHSLWWWHLAHWMKHIMWLVSLLNCPVISFEVGRKE